MFPVAILAGGLATRLHPITQTIPKALVDVAGKPFIVRQLEYLREQGVQHVVLCIGYLGEMIQDVVGAGERFGLQVDYSPDGETLLGTGGALKKALPLLGEHFFILYGDSYLLVDFTGVQKAYALSGQQALMTVFENGDRWDKSNVLFKGGQLREYNKHAPRPDMAYIDYGLGVVAAEVFAQYPAEEPFDLADVYQTLSKKGSWPGLKYMIAFMRLVHIAV